MKLRYVGVGAALCGVLLAGCQGDDSSSLSSSSSSSSSSTQAAVRPNVTPTTAASTPAQVTPSPSATNATVKCHAKLAGGDNWLPDKKCTPGIANRKVTQANIKSTICKSGWADQQRKLLSVTFYAKNKVLSLQQYGFYAGRSLGDYEYDHLVPISVGGAPGDLRNLWPEHDATPNPKDAIEAKVRAAVCAGRMTLATARKGFQTNWTTIKVPTTPKSGAHRKAPVPVPRPKPAPQPAPRIHTVHPGAFCSPAGATGVSSKGVVYTCKGPGQPRWRR